MRSEQNCEDLIKCPSPWLFSGRVSTPPYSLVHSGSLMHYVMPRTPKNNCCQRNFLEGQDVLTELHACLQSSHDKACPVPHPTVLQQWDERTGSGCTEFSVWMSQEVRTRLTAFVYSENRNHFIMCCTHLPDW